MGYVGPFDQDKFKELVLYIAQKCAQDSGFGRTKLNKALWWSDFQAFARFGRSITGAKYIRMPYGPVPRAINSMLGELALENAVVEEDNPVRGGFVQQRIRARRAPDVSVFSAQELQLINDVIDGLWNRKATGVSNLSHKQSAGWRLTPDREIIPYETVFVAARKAKPADRGWAKKVAREHGWL